MKSFLLDNWILGIQNYRIIKDLKRPFTLHTCPLLIGVKSQTASDFWQSTARLYRLLQRVTSSRLGKWSFLVWRWPLLSILSSTDTKKDYLIPPYRVASIHWRYIYFPFFQSLYRLKKPKQFLGSRLLKFYFLSRLRFFSHERITLNWIEYSKWNRKISSRVNGQYSFFYKLVWYLFRHTIH